MEPDIQHIEQRTRRYWYIDGIAEVVMGGVSLILGVYFLLQALLPEESLLSQLLNAGMALVIIGLVFLSRRIIAFAKERLTYPRSGYVSYRQPPANRRWIAAGAALVIAALAVLLSAKAPPVVAWVPLISGILIGAALVYFSYKVSVGRIFVLAVLSLLLGLALGFSSLEDILGLAIYYALMGLAFSISGGLTLARYLRLSGPIQEVPVEGSNEDSGGGPEE
jgi:hypothetical protein